MLIRSLCQILTGCKQNRLYATQDASMTFHCQLHPKNSVFHFRCIVQSRDYNRWFPLVRLKRLGVYASWARETSVALGRSKLQRVESFLISDEEKVESG